MSAINNSKVTSILDILYNILLGSFRYKEVENKRNPF